MAKPAKCISVKCQMIITGSIKALQRNAYSVRITGTFLLVLMH